MTLKDKIIKETIAKQNKKKPIVECPVYIETDKHFNELLETDIYCNYHPKDNYYLHSGSILGRPVLINMKLLNLKVETKVKL